MISSLLLVGCGKMGSALLAGWQRDDAPSIGQLSVVDPNRYQESTPDVGWYKALDALPADYAPQVVVLATKPQDLDALLPVYRARFAGCNPLYISIAAGKDLTFYARQLGEHAHVVRAMPNSPALIGKGMTVLTAKGTLPQSARHTATMLMRVTGRVEWVDDESLMDPVTALSGSGPAYVFYFLECLTAAGVASGLGEDMARTLAIETLAGSAELARRSEENLADLRKNVASPGGTTEAALAVLMRGGTLEKLLTEAVLAAEKRSRELK